MVARIKFPLLCGFQLGWGLVSDHCGWLGSSTIDPVVCRPSSLRCRFRRLAQGHPDWRLDLNGAVGDDLEKVLTHRQDVRPLGQVHGQARERGKQRSLLQQEHDVEGRDRPGRKAEAGESAEGRRQSSEPGKVALPTPS